MTEYNNPIKVFYVDCIDKTVISDGEKIYFSGKNESITTCPVHTDVFYNDGRMFFVCVDKIRFNPLPGGEENLLRETAKAYISVNPEFGKIKCAVPCDGGVEILTETFRLKYGIGFEKNEIYLKSKERLTYLVSGNSAVKVGGKFRYLSDGKFISLSDDAKVETETLENFSYVGTAKSFDSYYVLPVKGDGKNLCFIYDTDKRKGNTVEFYGKVFGGYALKDGEVFFLGATALDCDAFWRSAHFNMGNLKRKVLRKIIVSGKGDFSVIVSGDYGEARLDFACSDTLYTHISSKEFQLTVFAKSADFSVDAINLYFK